VKPRNPETGTSTKTSFWSFGYRELEESRVETLHHRSPEVAKCETPKSRNRHINKDSILEFRIPEVGGVKSRDSSSQESRSCEMWNAEIPKQAHQQRLHFGVSDTRSWRSKKSRLFITGVLKLRNVKRRNNFRSFRGSQHGVSGVLGIATWRVEMPHHRNSQHAKFRNAEMRKTPFGVGFGYQELECRNTSPQ
jgi:hypothetical protein